MQNKEGIFSFNELSQLKDFCNKCAEEDRKIFEQRKKNSFYKPENKKPEPLKEAKPPSNQVSHTGNNNKFVKNQINHQNNYNNKDKIKEKKVNNIKSNNSNNYNYNQKQSNNSKRISESFKNRIKMFESKN